MKRQLLNILLLLLPDRPVPFLHCRLFPNLFLHRPEDASLLPHIFFCRPLHATNIQSLAPGVDLQMAGLTIPL